MTGPEPLADSLGDSSGDPYNAREAMLGWAQDIAPYGLFTTDADLVVRSWNQWMVTHSGLAAEAVIRRPLHELFPELVERKLDERFARALQGEISVLSTALHKYLLAFQPATREFDVLQMLQTARIAPLTAGEKIIGTVTIIEDVTQRECQAAILHRQQEHDRLLSHALEVLLKTERPREIAAELFPRLAAPLKLEVFFHYLLSPDGHELQLHAAAGVTPEVRKAMATLNLGEAFCGQVAQRREPMVVSFVQADTRPESAAIRQLGLRSYAGFPLVIGDRLLGTLSFGSYERDAAAPDEIEFLGKIAVYAAIALDRAMREESLREADRMLRRHAEDLESKVLERTAELNETIVQLESFSYTVAHDLRAPIRSLKGFSEILLADYAPALPPDARGLVLRLHRASNGLDALTRDLLAFSRIAQQEVALTPIDLSELVPEIAALSPALQEGVLTIRNPLGLVLAHRTLLQQCFSNLFDNALKFADSRRPVKIVVSAERRDNRIKVSVQDNGIGIPPELSRKIFEIFERIPGPAPVEGTGVGLAIVARAAEQMRGNYGVESTLGQGSRFWMEFAAADPR